MTSKPHLVVVAHTTQGNGGVAQVARMQAERLSSVFRVSIVCVSAAPASSDLKVHTVAVADFRWLRRFGHVATERMIAKRFLQKLKWIDARDKIHFALYHSHACASLCHGYFGNHVKSGMVVHGDINVRPVETYGSILSRFYKTHSKRAYKKIDLIVTLNPSMRERLISYGVDRKRLAVIENGLPMPTQAKPNDSCWLSNELRVLFVGRLSVEKDPLTLVKAIGACSETVRLIIAGQGPLESELEALVCDLGLTNRVEMLGFLTKAELEEQYKRAHVLCISSVSDPLPTVVLEAMSHGLPIIGSSVEGIPHMVDHGITGLLFPVGDVAALTNAIIRLAEDKTLAKQFGKAGFQKFQSDFSIEVTSNKLINAINHTLEHGGPQL